MHVVVEPDLGIRENQVINGKYFGYPECCIDAFSNRKFLNSHTDEQKEVSNGTGFIPCQKHALEILAGKIKIDDLITNRECKFPFPQESELSTPEELSVLLEEDFAEFDYELECFKHDLRNMPYGHSIEYFNLVKNALTQAMGLVDKDPKRPHDSIYSQTGDKESLLRVVGNDD